jgi:hypothetical protein
VCGGSGSFSGRGATAREARGSGRRTRSWRTFCEKARGLFGGRILTEVDLCGVCSCQERLRRNCLREGAWRTLTPEEEEEAEETDRPSWVSILKTYQDAGQSLAQMEAMLREGFLRTYRGVGNLLNRDELIDDTQVTADDDAIIPSARMRHVCSAPVCAGGVRAASLTPLRWGPRMCSGFASCPNASERRWGATQPQRSSSRASRRTRWRTTCPR